MKTAILLFFIITSAAGSFCQNRNSVWCFGDSAGIKFNQGSTQVFTSSSLTVGGSCSICDTSGNLLFYATTDYYPLWLQGFGGLGVVFNKTHSVMQNGDTLIGDAWFQEQVIVPHPDSSNLFYLFGTAVTIFNGLYYSLIDMNQNGGLGAVIQKNIQITNVKVSDCVSAIKHGNGRDWWVMFRRWDFINNSYYRYLVTSSGISPQTIQNIGTPSDNGFLRFCFSKNGDRILTIDYRGLVEVADFDRCTGLLSNVITIEQETISPFPNYLGSSFSPSGRFIYVSTVDDSTTYLYQFDLQAANISASKIAIDSVHSPSFFGMIRLAPDDKIYCSHNYFDGIQTYPYTDSLNNMYNENLSVVNYPDSPGVACGFSPFSFYLGGNETYWGLPNNPQYDMPALSGSPCDSLTGISNTLPQVSDAALYVFYHTAWQKAFINAKGLKGKNIKLTVCDLLGHVVFTEEVRGGAYFTKDLNCASFAKGMYLVTLVTEKEQLVKKFIKD